MISTDKIHVLWNIDEFLKQSINANAFQTDAKLIPCHMSALIARKIRLTSIDLVSRSRQPYSTFAMF